MASIKLDSDGNILDGYNRIRAMEEMKDLKEEMKEMKIVVDSDGNILNGNNRVKAFEELTAELMKTAEPALSNSASRSVIEMDDKLLSKLIGMIGNK